MSRSTEHLFDWLRDAHAMEQHAERMLSATADRLQAYPELKERVLRHLDETRQQASLVRGCLERLGGTTSAMKDVAGMMTAMTQGLGSTMASDEVIKDLHAGYVFEQFEIATYETLIAGADALGDAETARVCRGILAEEQAMADWLRQHFPRIIGQFLSREEARPGAGKR